MSGELIIHDKLYPFTMEALFNLNYSKYNGQRPLAVMKDVVMFLSLYNHFSIKIDQFFRDRLQLMVDRYSILFLDFFLKKRKAMDIYQQLKVEV